MPSLLRIDASIDPLASRSRSITQAFTDRWRARGPEFRVVERDLGRSPIPHLADAALHWPERLRPAGTVVPAEDAARQQALIAELLAADVLLLGAPMYNYSIPSALKAWLDHVHVPGLTADFDVPASPMRGRPAVIVATRGASYDPGSPTADWDHTVPPLRLVLGEALGMDVRVITASRTLADTVPFLAAERERAHAELEAATGEAVRLAGELGGTGAK